LVIVPTPERHFSTADEYDDIALRAIDVASYPYFGGGMLGEI
jgi:hypothetical protein